MTTSTTYIFPGRKRGKKEIKMSSNYAFVASLSTTSPPGNNFVGLVVVPKNQASSCLSAVVLSSVVCQEKSKNQPTLWFFGETTTHFFCNIGIHILQQRYILHHTAYWFAILMIIFAAKKSEMIWNFANNKALSRSSHIEY